MQIHRLKLSGFKSFVEPAELRIEPGLTGVVGPNGCGKSNLLEAIRWVMGETSAKSMRSGGMEDVIFAGTSTRPPRDFAEVVLHAQDDAGEVEAVLAGDQRALRLLLEFGGEASVDAFGLVRRIAEDQVELRTLRQRRHGVRLVQRDTFRQLVVGDVERGHFERLRREVGRVDVRLREALREQDGEAARARADVGHPFHLLDRRQPAGDGFGDQFHEVRARYDDAFIDAETQATEPGFADEVASGYAIKHTAFDQREEGGLLLGCQGAFEARGELLPGQARGMAHERQGFFLGVHEALAVRDAGRLEQTIGKA